MSVPPVSITATPGPGDGVPATAASNEMLAGFIVWLARRRLPVGRRRALHREVERFLRWRTSPGQTRGGATLYLRQLRQAGHSEAELTVAGEAIGRLRAHLTEQRTHHSADHSTHHGTDHGAPPDGVAPTGGRAGPASDIPASG